MCPCNCVNQDFVSYQDIIKLGITGYRILGSLLLKFDHAGKLATSNLTLMDHEILLLIAFTSNMSRSGKKVNGTSGPVSGDVTVTTLFFFLLPADVGVAHV